MADFRRKRRHLRLPIWSSLVLVSVNLTLMIIMIVLLAKLHAWPALTLGAIALGISLFGMTFYSFLTIKEIQLNRRQANFVDSVTHELKTPIAALRLYLDTLMLREPKEEDRREFYDVMETELNRLDELINQLLEVGRLDAIGSQTDPEEIGLTSLLKACATNVAHRYKLPPDDVFEFDGSSMVINGRQLILEMIFGNVLDNAVKYGGHPPQVKVTCFERGRSRFVVRIQDNGRGVPTELRSQIFQLFYRGKDELQRTRKGTGLGLYIVRTLVNLQKGRISVTDGPGGRGSVFEIVLPGRIRQEGERANPPSAKASGNKLTEVVKAETP